MNLATGNPTFEGEEGRDGGWEERGGSYESPPLNTKQLFPVQLLNGIYIAFQFLFFHWKRVSADLLLSCWELDSTNWRKKKKTSMLLQPDKRSHDIMVNTVRKKSRQNCEHSKYCWELFYLSCFERRNH
jgi:hypothetical protein